MKLIGRYSTEEYTIENADTNEVLYRADSKDYKGEKADIDSIKLWCEQTGLDMAEAMEAKFLGTVRKESEE